MAKRVGARVQISEQIVASRMEEFARIKAGTNELYRGLSILVSSTHDYLANTARPESLVERNSKGRMKQLYKLQFSPTVRLLADYMAFQTVEPFPKRSGPWLDWTEEVIAESRDHLVTLSLQPFASAFRAIRYIAEATLPVPDDPFKTDDLFDCLRWQVIAGHPELGVIHDHENGYQKLEVNPSIECDPYALQTALACGFSRQGVPESALMPPLFRTLAKQVSANKSIPAAIKTVRTRQLAKYLSQLATFDDLTLIWEQLQIEFAKVAAVVRGLAADEAIAVARNGKSNRRDWPRKLKARGSFAYKLARDPEVSLKELLAGYNAKANQSGWEPYTHWNSVKRLAMLYATDMELPPIPRRRSN